MQRHQIFALLLSIALVAGCQTQPRKAAPAPLPTADNGIQGTVVGDERTAMEAAIDTVRSSLLRRLRRRRRRRAASCWPRTRRTATS